MAFSDETILEVSRTADFTDPEATAYMAQTLITRRDKIGQLWLNVVLPVDDFDLTADGVLTFRNIALESKAAVPGRGYTVAWARFDNATGTATPSASRRSSPSAHHGPTGGARRRLRAGHAHRRPPDPPRLGHPNHHRLPPGRCGVDSWSASTGSLLRSTGDSDRHRALPRLPARPGGRPPHGHRDAVGQPRRAGGVERREPIRVALRFALGHALVLLVGAGGVLLLGWQIPGAGRTHRRNRRRRAADSDGRLHALGRRRRATLRPHAPRRVAAVARAFRAARPPSRRPPRTPAARACSARCSPSAACGR